MALIQGKQIKVNLTGSFTGSFSGAFSGSGANLFDIPASGIVGLNLSQISSGSVSASISPDNGLQVNTNVTATSFTGSLFGTSSFATSASYVQNQILTPTLLDYYLGTRLTPTNTSYNGFDIEKSINGNVGYTVRNLDNTGNGALASIGVQGSGSGYYDGGISLNAVNNGYYITYLRNTGFIYSSRDAKVIGKTLDFRTGVISTATTGLSISQSLVTIPGTLTVSQGITGSLFGTSSWAVSSSQALTASYVNPLNQNVLISGSLKFDPTQDPDPTGLDLDSTTLFQSSSNTALGYDLYIRQNGNVVKWKWVEGVLETGLLYGGVVTYSGSNVFVSPGSGIIAEHNATTGSEIGPIVTYVTWNAITQSIANISTQQVTYLYIDGNGDLQQQSSRFTAQQYHDYIPLGAVGHFDYTQVSAFGGAVQTAYDQISQISSFVDAFGPLKISGYGLTGQPGTLQLSVGSGTSFIHGGFYENNPEYPSQITTNAQATASIAYVFRSGSSVQFDTNGGNLYTSLRPGFYDPGTGITGSVSNNDWTIQRVFSDPKTGVIYIYYGQTIYPDFLTAVGGLATDPFTEGDTFDFTTFIGFLVLKSNTNDITDSDNKIVPAGLFRGSGQGSGGGIALSNLDDLTDVTITTPSDGEALVYNAGIWQNGTPTSASYALTASYLDNYVPPFPFTGSAEITGSLTVTGSITATSFTGSLFGTASYAVSSSQAVTASYALTGGDPTERYTDTFTATEGQTIFITTQPLIAGYYDAYLNGVRLNDNSYTASAYTLTLIDPCTSGDIVDITTYQLVRIGSRETRKNATDSVNENINYCGTAPAGSLENQNVWTIFKIVVATDGSVVRTFASDVAWTDRESVTYT